MKAEELDQVATALGVQLPEFYRNFILRHGAELADIQEHLTHRATLCYEPGNLLHYNRLVRDEPIGREAVPWPVEFFVVGVHFCEDYWFIKLDGSDECLWTCWADKCTFEKAHESFDDFLQELRNEWEQPAE